MPITRSNQLGAAAEAIVKAELLARGFDVTLPGAPNGTHDMHVKLRRGWRTVQVKLGIPSRKKVATMHRGLGKIQSDLIAVVSLPTKRIRWIARRGVVPRALREVTR